MPLGDIGKFIVSKFAMPKDGYTLAMDRTNWKFGKTHINLLVVGVVIEEMAVPIAWMALPQKNKRGNSNTIQRIEIMQQVLSIIPAKNIDVLTMDREFIGGRWLKWLDQQGVGFIARLNKNHKVNGVNAEKYHKSPYSRKTSKVEVWGMKVFFGGKSIQKGRDPYLYVISNKYESKKALRIYKKRWAIERLFSHLKKRGFNLEDTHMTDPRKLERLFGVITISFFVTYSLGKILATETKLNASEKKKSIFRLGLESLMEMLCTNNNPSSSPISLDLIQPPWLLNRDHNGVIELEVEYCLN